MKSKQIYKELTKLIRIDSGMHRELKILSGKTARSIKELVEEGCAEILKLYDDK